MYYVAERILRTALQSLSFIFVARYLSPEAFGHIGFASSVLATMSVISIFGLDQIVIRSASKANINALNVAVRAISVSIIIGLILGIIMALTAVLSPTPFERDAFILLSFAVPMAFASIAQVYLMTIRRNKWLSVVLLFEAVVLSLARIIFCILEAQAFSFIILIFVDAALVALISITALFLSSKRPVRLRVDLKGFKVLFLSGAPLAANTVVAFLYMRVDQFMLRIYDSAEALGIYIVALKFIEIASLLIMTVLRSYTPGLLRIFSKDENGFYFVIESLLSKVFALTGVICIVIFFFGETFISSVFGASYAESGIILAVLVLTIPALIIGQCSVMISVSRSSFALPFLRTLFGLAVNILGNFNLIPILGGLGAAIATVVSFWLSAILTLLFTKEDRPLFFSTIRAATLSRVFR